MISIKKQDKIIAAILFFLFFVVLGQTGRAQGGDYAFYKNFVRHADGSSCEHLPPQTGFTAYLNSDQSKILLENAPRWKSGVEPNIAGNGTFGVEFGNFADPMLAVGDSVFIRFTCNATGQQGTLSDKVIVLPWFTFPATLKLAVVNLPSPPLDLHLSIDSTTFHRTISWTAVPGLSYDVYRRAYSDTIPDGRARMLYTRIGQIISSGQFIDTTSIGGEKYGYVVYAINGEGVRSSHSEEVNEDPHVKPGLDLTISYIARLPRLNYIWGSSNPGVEGWPSLGAAVTWRAVIKNWADSTLHSVKYRWLLDGMVVDTGFVDMPPRDTATVGYLWSWTFDRHTLRFVLDPDDQVAEEEEGNNELMIYTDAIAAGFYVEQSVYDYFHQFQKMLGVHSNCWEDWAQRHVRTWNEMFANAIYPDSPDGVLDRIRLDKITVVPDGALPLVPGWLPSNAPNANDRTIDLQWGFTQDLLSGSFYADHTNASTSNPFYFEGSLMHELGHARYLIDLYGLNVHDDGSGNTIAIRENGALIVGTPYMPLMGDAVHYTPINGLMNGQYTYVDEYSTAALNLITGHRAVSGNYNAPNNIGVFLQDLPQHNRMTIKDQDGDILPGANVQVFQATGQPGVWYGKHYDSIPDMQFTADTNGVVELERCPFSANGQIAHTYGLSNSVIILRVAHDHRVGYGFFEVTRFNMEYWRGHTQQGDYQLKVNMIETSGIAGKQNANLPGQFSLLQNYPNPFNPSTRISYRIPHQANVKLVVYNTLGQLIRTLVQKKQPAGEYSVEWDGLDNSGMTAPSGVYFYRLDSQDSHAVRKMILMH
jgi:hypothetical protein